MGIPCSDYGMADGLIREDYCMVPPHDHQLRARLTNPPSEELYGS